jgi:DNA-binding transcriptional LysR family regulator
VRKLEEEFGLQLLERGARGTALTPAGRTFYGHALEFAELVAATRGDMAGEAAALRGSIRLGVVPALLNSLATPVLADLVQSPGDIHLLLSVRHSAEVVRMVQDARLDLAVCFGVQHLPPSIVRSCVARQRYGWWCVPGIRGKDRRPVWMRSRGSAGSCLGPMRR